MAVDAGGLRCGKARPPAKRSRATAAADRSGGSVGIGMTEIGRATGAGCKYLCGIPRRRRGAEGEGGVRVLRLRGHVGRLGVDSRRHCLRSSERGRRLGG